MIGLFIQVYLIKIMIDAIIAIPLLFGVLFGFCKMNDITIKEFFKTIFEKQ